MKFVLLRIKPIMKSLKILIIILISFTFSDCYFLDYVIPEEYFAEEANVGENYYNSQYPEIYSEYVWIIHIPIQSDNKNYFSSLTNAINSLKKLGVTVFDAREYDIAHRNININKSKKKVRYSAKIKSADLHKLLYTNWQFWYNTKNNNRE